MTATNTSTGISFKELTASDWHTLERLFGSKGACGGCWCMHWWVPKGGKAWEAVKGEPNRRAMRKLVLCGKALGILALDGDRAVGWCSFGKRSDFPRLETVKAYRRTDVHRIWSINCLFLAKDYRRRGLSSQLVEAAVKAIRKRRGKIIEAYPVTLTKAGNKLPPAFSFTGPEIIYQRLGFKEIQRLSSSRPLYRLEL